MKRRDFLRATATVTGAVVPGWALGQTKPCPPPGFSATGGTSVTASCAAATDGLADWQARSTGSGVLWAHRFSSPTDGGLYWGQASGNTDGGKRFGYKAGDGILGDGCLEIYVPAGTSIKGGWSRPIAPVTGAPAVGSYLAYPADINKAGIPAIDYKSFYSTIPGEPSAKWYNGGGGLFTNPHDFANNNRSLSNGQKEMVYGGANGFYLQYRVKFPVLANGKSRLDYSGVAGKMLMISNFARSNPTSEIVTNVVPDHGNMYYMYGARGEYIGVLNDPQGGDGRGARLHPGGDEPYGTQCIVRPEGGGYPVLPLTGQCWSWPEDEWVTVLVQVIPGRHNPGDRYQSTWLSTAPYKDSGIRVWVAKQSEIDAARAAGRTPQYTKIWDKVDYAFVYDAEYPAAGTFELKGQKQGAGYSFITFTPFANPNGTTAEAYDKDVVHLHDQVICSTQWIPCPLV